MPLISVRRQGDESFNTFLGNREGRVCSRDDTDI